MAAGTPGAAPATTTVLTSASPARAAAAPSAEARQKRQSQRALRQAKQSFGAMLAQAQVVAADLQPDDRDALLAYIVDEHFPELERFVERLRDTH